jgi:hypothetical protein
MKGEVDWEYLLRMAHRHRLTPLLYWQLNTICPEVVPESHLSSLRAKFYRNTARNLNLTKELCKVLELFEVHGIPAIPYKGPALAASIYGSLALRQFSDLDILIRRKDVAKASEILELRGYKKEYQLTAAQEAAFLKIECEHVFTDNQRRVYLDLHWDFVRSYFSLKLDLDGFWERLERIPLGSIEVLSFAPEDLLLILCVNASKEFWERLVQICDIAELIRAYPNLNWDAVIRRAARMGTGRMLYLSLLLAHDLFGSVVPEEVTTKIAVDTEVRNLFLEIRQGLFEDEIKTTSKLKFLRPAKALERLSDRAKFYLRLGLTPTMEDWAFINLPRPLFFLYYLTRPIRLTKKYILHH